MKANARLLVAGGGTGGHVSAGIAVMEAWRERFGPDSVLFVGAKGGLEERMVPKANLPLALLRVGPLNRVSTVVRLKSMVLLFGSLFRCLSILVTFKPTAVLGVGGFASGPVVAIASFISVFSKTRIAILEQNAVMGLTNRLLARRAHIVFSAFADFSAQKFSSKVRVIGNPVRKDLVHTVRSSTKRFSIFVFGGSRGAMGLNSAFIEALRRVDSQRRNEWQILHQTGELEFDRMQKLYEELEMQVTLVRFIDDMQSAYAEASLVVCRAGASSLAELARVGRAAILVPLPTAADNHQEKNARIFEGRSAAWIVRQSDPPEAFASMLLRLSENAEQLSTVEKNVLKLDRAQPEITILNELTRQESNV